MKFNKTISTKTINFAGGEGFSQTPKLEFVSILLTSFLKDQFYREENETLDRIRTLFKQLDPIFCAKTALYARNEFGMRSVSHVVAGEIAASVKGQNWTKKFFEKIIHRPDDMLEILAYYYSLGQKNEPNALKKGFAKVLEKLNEYELAKYKANGSEVSMVDLVNLVHPKNTEAVKKLMAGKLNSAETWEVLLSKAGSDEKKKKKVWHDLLSEHKLGYFALLRNMRNILEQDEKDIDLACENLVNENVIKKSLVLPFRFTTAIKELEGVDGSRKVLIALNKAVDISLSNVPKFDGKTLVVLDGSGSMASGDGKPLEIGSLFAAVLTKVNDADLIIFSEDAKYLSINPLDSTLTIANMIASKAESAGTNFHSIFETANKDYDRIIIMSDMQGWIGGNAPTSTFNKYKARTGAKPFIYSFDLAGYGTMEFPEPNVFCLAGFSDKVLDIMRFLEKDKNVLLNTIEETEI